MKAQLTFLAIFMKVLILLLVLTLCHTGKKQQPPASNVTQQSPATGKQNKGELILLARLFGQIPSPIPTDMTL